MTQVTEALLQVGPTAPAVLLPDALSVQVKAAELLLDPTSPHHAATPLDPMVRDLGEAMCHTFRDHGDQAVSGGKWHLLHATGPEGIAELTLGIRATHDEAAGFVAVANVLRPEALPEEVRQAIGAHRSGLAFNAQVRQAGQDSFGRPAPSSSLEITYPDPAPVTLGRTLGRASSYDRVLTINGQARRGVVEGAESRTQLVNGFLVPYLGRFTAQSVDFSAPAQALARAHELRLI